MGIVAGIAMAYSAYEGSRAAKRSANASTNAANIQAGATDQGIAYQREALNKLIDLQQPYMDLGRSVLPLYSGEAVTPVNRQALDAVYDAVGITRMPQTYNQVSNPSYTPPTNLSAEGASILGRSTWNPQQGSDGVTPNALGRDQYGNGVLSNTPTAQARPSPPQGNGGINTSGSYGDGYIPVDWWREAGYETEAEADADSFTPSDYLQMMGENNNDSQVVAGLLGNSTWSPPAQSTQASSGAQSAQPDQSDSLLNKLTDLTGNPAAQADYLRNNEFYNAIADDVQDRLFANKAAKGKLGSGETAIDLQNKLMLLGPQLVDRDINNLGYGLNTQIGQLLNLQGAESGYRQNRLNSLLQPIQVGQNAAALTGSNIQQGTNQITGLLGGGADARAAGLVGAANARNQGSQNMLNLLTTAYGMYS